MLKYVWSKNILKVQYHSTACTPHNLIQKCFAFFKQVRCVRICFEIKNNWKNIKKCLKTNKICDCKPLTVGQKGPTGWNGGWCNCPVSPIMYFKKTLVVVFPLYGWAPRSFTFWTHRSFAFFKSMQRSFAFFFWVFGDLWDPKERCNLLHSFLKNIKERKERNILLQRT